MITVDGLQKAFGDIQAVAGVSFSIAAGEAFGLLGPNGAGKSTTIQMLVGAMAPDAGRVTLAGLGGPANPQARRVIGMAPQELAIYPKLTAQENLSFFGGIYGLRASRLRERVRWGLDFAGLSGRKSDRVKTFSGGMKRRRPSIAQPHFRQH